MSIRRILLVVNPTGGVRNGLEILNTHLILNLQLMFGLNQKFFLRITMATTTLHRFFMILVNQVTLPA